MIWSCELLGLAGHEEVEHEDLNVGFDDFQGIAQLPQNDNHQGLGPLKAAVAVSGPIPITPSPKWRPGIENPNI